MKVAITGTPGTGKTSASQMVSEKLKYKLISLTDIAEKNDLFEDYDEKRDTHVVDAEKLNEVVQKELKKTKNVLLDGHLGHFLKELDLVIILRTNPNDLRRRLETKGWAKGKIIENVQAEILDIILQEAVQLHKDVYEVDSTKRPIRTVAADIIKIIQEPESREPFKPGKIDWTGYSSYF